ncbi:hypothetical protein D3C76_1449240 [compost metagenome]
MACPIPAMALWSIACMPVGVSMPCSCICSISCWCRACIAASPRLNSCSNWPLLTSTKRTVSPALISIDLGVNVMSAMSTSMLRVALAAGAG